MFLSVSNVPLSPCSAFRLSCVVLILTLTPLKLPADSLLYFTTLALLALSFFLHPKDICVADTMGWVRWLTPGDGGPYLPAYRQYLSPRRYATGGNSTFNGASKGIVYIEDSNTAYRGIQLVFGSESNRRTHGGLVLLLFVAGQLFAGGSRQSNGRQQWE